MLSIEQQTLSILYDCPSKLTFICSKSTIETLENRFETSSTLTIKTPKDAIDVILVFVLLVFLSLDIFHTIF